MVIPVYGTQSFINAIWLNRSFTQKLKDSYIQEWYSKIDTSSGSNNHRLFKTKFETSSYINCMSKYFCRRFLSFRTVAGRHSLDQRCHISITAQWALHQHSSTFALRSSSTHDKICQVSVFVYLY